MPAGLFYARDMKQSIRREIAFINRYGNAYEAKFSIVFIVFDKEHTQTDNFDENIVNCLRETDKVFRIKNGVVILLPHTGKIDAFNIGELINGRMPKVESVFVSEFPKDASSADELFEDISRQLNNTEERSLFEQFLSFI